MTDITDSISSLNKKKLAILLYGKAQNSYKHHRGGDFKVDYTYSYKNYKEFIFEHYENKNYEIDIYFVAAKFDIKENQQELVNKYNPVKYLFVENKTQSYSIVGKNSKVKKVIELCLSTEISYDLVLMTRFDLAFQKKFSESNIDENKFNFVSILEIPNAVCDNFYVFPFTFLKDFYSIICNNLEMNSHFLRVPIKKRKSSKFINFINNEYCSVNQLSFYKICRIHKDKLYYDGTELRNLIKSLNIISVPDFSFSKSTSKDKKIKNNWIGYSIFPNSVKAVIKFDIKFLSDIPNQSDNFAIKSQCPEISYKQWLTECKKNEFVHIEFPIFFSKEKQLLAFVADNYYPELNFLIKNFKICYCNEKINSKDETVALVYRGHYKRTSSAWSESGNGFDIDILKNQLDSIYSIGIKKIDIYFHSYSVSDEDDYNLLKLLSKYNLVNFSLTKNESYERQYSVIESLKLVEDRYKFIINTRFDLYFLKQLKDVNIADDKFNICFKDFKKFWKKDKKISDLLWIFPFKYIKNLIRASKVTSVIDPMSLHCIVNHLLLDGNELHFMIRGFFTSTTCNQKEMQQDFIYIKRMQFKDKLTKDEDKLTKDEDKLTKDEDKLTKDEDKLTKDEDKLTKDEDKLTKDEDKLTTDEDKLTTDQENN